MASGFKVNDACANAALDALAALADAGAGGARIEIRTGSPPANITDASTGTLLATLTASTTMFGAASSRTITAAAITDDSSADASGDAGYYRVYHDGAADTAAVFQGTAGESGDTPDMVFNNKSIVTGGIVAISSFTISL